MVKINFQAQIMNHYANRYDPAEIIKKKRMAKTKKADWIPYLLPLRMWKGLCLKRYFMLK